MGGAFEWLNRIFEYLWAFVPRPYLVVSTHRAVRYRRGRKPVLVMPGLRWYWPLTTLVKVINITLRAQEFRSHVYTTKDGKSIAVAYTMVYLVSNPVKADSSCDNYEQTLGEIGESILSPVIASSTLQELLDQLADDTEECGFNATVTTVARKMAKRFGVRVTYCRVHTFAATRVIKLLQEQ